ncbi:hypothetical protein Tco_0890471 [Tanacetum coccineum]|uniref:Uncharacterized protein n=1 Tax=Tanacetum coccineum TaxID=301880 RepID=A0ABQ5C5M6_9ASTR
MGSLCEFANRSNSFLDIWPVMAAYVKAPPLSPEVIRVGTPEPSDVGSPGVIVYGYDGLIMHLVAPPSLNYVPGLEHPPSPNYVLGPEHPPSLVYLPEPEYLEYLVPSGDEDPEEDHVDYPADEGNCDDESFDDDDDDDDADDEDEDAYKDEEEKEHLAPAYSSAVPVVDLVPLAGDIEAFETDEFAPTPPSPRSPQILVPLSQTQLCRARKTVRPQTCIPFPSETHVARLLALHISPPSPLTPLSSLLPHIPSPPLHVSSPPLPLPSPTVDSPTYVKAPLGYRAAGIRMRAASPPLLLSSTSYRTDIPEAEMPPQKKACFTNPASRFEVEESSAAGAARHHGLDVAVMDATAGRPMSREATYAHRAWTSSKERSATIEAHVRILETLEARDLEPQDELAEAGSSC